MSYYSILTIVLTCKLIVYTEIENFKASNLIRIQNTKLVHIIVKEFFMFISLRKKIKQESYVYSFARYSLIEKYDKT